MKFTFEPAEIHKIVQDHVRKTKLMGKVDYTRLVTEFREDESGWTGEIEASIEEPEDGEK